jgi:hypothetical protein
MLGVVKEYATCYKTLGTCHLHVTCLLVTWEVMGAKYDKVKKYRRKR